MPSLNSRSVDLSSNYAQVQPGAAAQPASSIPTPAPHYIGRSPMMTSSLPSIASTHDAALRQFYGGRNLPVRRVSQF